MELYNKKYVYFEWNDELNVLCADGIPESIQNILKDMGNICDRWCY